MTVPDPSLWSLPIGFALDAAIGDPDGWPHPVRAIGRLIDLTERILRRLLARIHAGPKAERFAGVILAVVVVSTTGLAAWVFVACCDRMGSAASLLGRSLLIFWGLAARSLGDEAIRASHAPDLATARRALSRIVGRDTENLDMPDVCRACVETLSENATDAVIALLFWLALGGPVALWVFKAASTLDSMVGYRNDRYLRLGWASARLDDAMALVPARLSWLLIALASLFVGERPGAALRIGWRDGRKHPSPNSAWGEAAMAGALGIALGGPATYGGASSFKPLLGDTGTPLDPSIVRRALRVFWIASGLAALLAWALRALVLGYSRSLLSSNLHG